MRKSARLHTYKAHNPGREIEILDVAPVDLLHGMSKAFINTLPIPSVFKEQGLDVEIHWVNEHGDLARLTSGITLQATVRPPPHQAAGHLN